MRQGQNTSRGAPDPLERGRFSDGRREYNVRASSESAPDSFQVYANGNPADIVLVVAGLTSWNLHATWGDGWRSADAEWKEWCQDQAFLAFYNGRPPVASRTRVCNG